MVQKNNALFAKRHTVGNVCLEKSRPARREPVVARRRLPSHTAYHVNGASPPGDNAGDEKDFIVRHHGSDHPQCHRLWHVPQFVWLSQRVLSNADVSQSADLCSGLLSAGMPDPGMRSVLRKWFFGQLRVRRQRTDDAWSRNGQRRRGQLLQLWRVSTGQESVAVRLHGIDVVRLSPPSVAKKVGSLEGTG